jgi:hypothetical protein
MDMDTILSMRNLAPATQMSSTPPGSSSRRRQRQRPEAEEPLDRYLSADEASIVTNIWLEEEQQQQQRQRQRQQQTTTTTTTKKPLTKRVAVEVQRYPSEPIEQQRDGVDGGYYGEGDLLSIETSTTDNWSGSGSGSGSSSAESSKSSIEELNINTHPHPSLSHSRSSVSNTTIDLTKSTSTSASASTSGNINRDGTRSSISTSSSVEEEPEDSDSDSDSTWLDPEPIDLTKSTSSVSGVSGSGKINDARYYKKTAWGARPKGRTLSKVLNIKTTKKAKAKKGSTKNRTTRPKKEQLTLSSIWDSTRPTTPTPTVTTHNKAPSPVPFPATALFTPDEIVQSANHKIGNAFKRHHNNNKNGNTSTSTTSAKKMPANNQHRMDSRDDDDDDDDPNNVDLQERLDITQGLLDSLRSSALTLNQTLSEGYYNVLGGLKGRSPSMESDDESTRPTNTSTNAEDTYTPNGRTNHEEGNLHQMDSEDSYLLDVIAATFATAAHLTEETTARQTSKSIEKSSQENVNTSVSNNIWSKDIKTETATPPRNTTTAANADTYKDGSLHQMDREDSDSDVLNVIASTFETAANLTEETVARQTYKSQNVKSSVSNNQASILSIEKAFNTIGKRVKKKIREAPRKMEESVTMMLIGELKPSPSQDNNSWSSSSSSDESYGDCHQHRNKNNNAADESIEVASFTSYHQDLSTTTASSSQPSVIHHGRNQFDVITPSSDEEDEEENSLSEEEFEVSYNNTHNKSCIINNNHNNNNHNNTKSINNTTITNNNNTKARSNSPPAQKDSGDSSRNHRSSSTTTTTTTTKAKAKAKAKANAAAETKHAAVSLSKLMTKMKAKRASAKKKTIKQQQQYPYFPREMVVKPITMTGHVKYEVIQPREVIIPKRRSFVCGQ